MSKWLLWLLRVLTWDGLLPLAVMAIPLVVRGLAPQPAAKPFVLLELISVLFATVAFLVRAGIGLKTLATTGHGWQRLVFFAGLFPLALSETVLMLMAGNQAAGGVPWDFCVPLYAAYVTLMAIAFLPLRAPPEAQHQVA